MKKLLTGATIAAVVAGGAALVTSLSPTVAIAHAELGNSWEAEFNGWACNTPTATAAEEYGYMGSCVRRADEIQIVPPPAQPASYLVPVSAPGDVCDAGAISEGVGVPVSVVRCHGDWAY